MKQPAKSILFLAVLTLANGCATHNALHIGEYQIDGAEPERIGELNDRTVVMEFRPPFRPFKESFVTDKWGYMLVPRDIFYEWVHEAKFHSINFAPLENPNWDRRRISLKYRFIHANCPKMILQKNPHRANTLIGGYSISKINWYPRIQDNGIRVFKIQRENHDSYIKFSTYDYPTKPLNAWWAKPVRVILVPIAVIFDAATAIIQIPLFSVADSFNEAFLAPRGYNPWKDGP